MKSTTTDSDSTACACQCTDVKDKEPIDWKAVLHEAFNCVSWGCLGACFAAIILFNNSKVPTQYDIIWCCIGTVFFSLASWRLGGGE